MAVLLNRMFIKSEMLADGRLRCIIPPSRAGTLKNNILKILLLFFICCNVYAIYNLVLETFFQLIRVNLFKF